MAFVCYDVDNLVLYQLELSDIAQLVQTNKYWKRRMGWFIEDYKKVKNLQLNDKIVNDDFQGACYIDSLKMAKWLWEEHDHTIDIHADNEFAFRSSCGNNFLEVAKWLWHISNHTIDIHVANEWTFELSCIYGHFEVAKWLWDISNHTINIHVENEFAFRYSCGRGHLEVAKWLWDISNFAIDIHADNKLAFKYSCHFDHLEVAKWLCQICPDYSIKYQEDKIKKAMYKGETIYPEN